MKRTIDKKLAMWLLATLALLVLAACGQTPTPVTDTHTVTVAVTGDGSVTGLGGALDCSAAGEDTCAATVDEGTEVTLTATANVTGESVTWGGACNGETGNTCTFTVTADTNVTATFAAPAGDPELSVSKTGDGTVTSSPAGIDCGDTCSATFASGTEVTLTATAGGNPFHSWGGACSGETTETCTLTVTDNTSVSVHFGLDAPEGYQITATSDDAEQLDNASTSNATAFPAGHTYVDSSDLDLAYDTAHGTTQHVGLRFSDLNIPQGATINSAKIVFTAAADNTSGTVIVNIWGEASATPATFNDDADTVASSDISTRPATTATVAWEITESWVAGNQYDSADITAIVQEIVNLGGWASGNELAIIMHGTNTTEYRTAESFGTGRTAPVLQVAFTAP